MLLVFWLIMQNSTICCKSFFIAQIIEERNRFNFFIQLSWVSITSRTISSFSFCKLEKLSTKRVRTKILTLISLITSWNKIIKSIIKKHWFLSYFLIFKYHNFLLFFLNSFAEEWRIVHRLCVLVLMLLIYFCCLSFWFIFLILFFYYYNHVINFLFKIRVCFLF